MTAILEGAFLARLAVFGLVLTRVTGLLLALPILSNEPVPMRIRAGLALACAFALSVGGPAAVAPMAMGGYVAGLIGELILGAGLGLIVRMAIAATEAAGTIIGMQMGMGFNSIVDPLTQAEGPLASLLAMLGWLFFLVTDGHHEVLRGLADSLHTVPAGTAASALSDRFFLRIIDRGDDLLGAALRISAPVMAVLLATNATVALTARVAPKVNFLIMTFLVGIAAGLLTLMLAAPSIGTTTLGLLSDAMREVRAIAQGR